MITFYIIKQTDNNADLNSRSEALRIASEKRNITFVELIAEKTDHRSLPKLGKNDLLYNIGRGFEAQTLESLLLNKDVTTFYKKVPALNEHISTDHWNIVLEKNSMPMPPTIYNPTNDKALLENYVAFLGGFPLILKVSGKSVGIGVMKIDTLGGLFSVTDYLLSINKHFVLKKFIDSGHSIRAVVLGGEVVAAAEFICDENEFRSNTGLGNKVQRSISVDQNIKNTAIKCAELLNFDFAAIDIVIDKDGAHYVLEVNFPFGFIPLNPLNNHSWDILEERMVDFLINKQRANE